MKSSASLPMFTTKIFDSALIFSSTTMQNSNYMNPFKHFCLLVVMMAAGTAFAQTTQTGVVKQYNEKKEKTPLAGVSLDVKHANSTVSDKDGRFTLQFQTLRPGEKVNVREIKKAGYEIFNKEALEQWNINPTVPFTIVLCKSEKIKKLHDLYYANASASYKRQNDTEKALLEKLKKEGKIKEQEYYEQLRALEDLYEKQLDNLQNYVDRFTRIDLSELSETEQSIIELVQEGRMDEAIQKYEEQKTVEKQINAIKARDAKRDAARQLEESANKDDEYIEAINAVNERFIETLRLAGGRENNEKIRGIYCAIADADTTNVRWLQKTGNFLSNYLAKYDEALRYYTLALDASKSQYGEEHADVAEALNNIGVIYSTKGEYSKAFEYYKRALTILESLYEAEHPNIASVFINISALYSNMGDYEKAMEYSSMALPIQKKLLGAEHPVVSASYNSMGSICLDMGDYDKALEYCNESLEIRENAFGEESLEVALTYNNIGRVYSRKKEHVKSLEYTSKALSILERILGTEHTCVALLYDNIGVTYGNMGDYYKALECSNKALKIYENLFGTMHPDVAKTYNNLGSAYQDIGDYNNALKHYNEGLAISKSLLGKQHPNVAATYDNIGLTYREMGDFSKALEYCGKGLEIWKELFGTEHPDVAISLSNIGSVYRDQGEYETALKYFSTALGIQERLFGTDHPSVGYSYANVGRAYWFLGDVDAALWNLDKSYEIMTKTLGEDHPAALGVKNDLNYIINCLMDLINKS